VSRVIIWEEREGRSRSVWSGSLDEFQNEWRSVRFGEAPAWTDYWAVCDLAERIGGLLDVLEGEGVALARTCSDDLDGLPVLADWCEEAGRLIVANEVRHLHGLVRHFRAALRAAPMPLVLWALDGWETDFE
jgi:hypothetical protein